jgi:H+/gluconate symporter-like permease
VLGNIGVLLGLALLIVLAVRGVNILIASIVSAAVVAVLNGLSMATAFGVDYIAAMFGFAGKYFFLFLTGAVFGRVMGESKAAASVAHALYDWLGASRALVIAALACAMLTYGGVNVFIVVFAIYPLGLSLVHRANIPKRLLLAAVAVGAGTFTMTAMPGTPSIHNVISAQNLGTSLAAAPLLGLVASAIMLALGLWYVEWQRGRALNRDEVFEAAPTDVLPDPDAGQERMPHWLTAGFPLLVVVGTILLPLWIAGRVDLDSASGPLVVLLRFTQEQQTLWPCAALVLGTLVATLTMRDFLPEIRPTLGRGAESAALPLLNTAAVIGFGGVVQATPSFSWFASLMLGSGLPPLVSAAISINIVAGIVGSASGGLGIWMPTLAQYYLDAGVPPEVLHRVVTVASGAFDTLPHCGALITYLTIFGMTHRQCYRDIFIICVAIPAVATAAIVALGLVAY